MLNWQGKEANKQGTGNDEGQVRPPAISLPKGGGAIRGIGEKFAANPVTGTGSMTVPIVTSPGRSGFGPQLSLSYDSGAGNGPFGFGWNLSLPAITRKTDKGLPQYWDAEESDVFILSGAEDLVPAFKRDENGNWIRNAQGDFVFDEAPRDGYMVRRYCPRIEGLFARIERWKQLQTGEVHWRSISRDNITTLYAGIGNVHAPRGARAMAAANESLGIYQAAHSEAAPKSATCLGPRRDSLQARADTIARTNGQGRGQARRADGQ